VRGSEAAWRWRSSSAGTSSARGRLRWWKRQTKVRERDAITWAPVVATEASSSASVIVRVGDAEIEARVDLVPVQWLADLVTALASSRTRA
jgi:hypothetical protein